MDKPDYMTNVEAGLVTIKNDGLKIVARILAETFITDQRKESVDMVADMIFDKALQGRAPCAKVDAPTREGDSDA